MQQQCQAGAVGAATFEPMLLLSTVVAAVSRLTMEARKQPFPIHRHELRYGTVVASEKIW